MMERSTSFRWLSVVLFAAALFLSGCGGGSSSSDPGQNGGPMANNWQFTMSAPPDNSFTGGLQGGFFLQDHNNVSGALTYSISAAQPSGAPQLCNSGSTPVSGTLNGNNVTLNAAVGALSYTLTGTLSADGSTIMGTYSTTDGQGCGTAQTDLPWSATVVRALTGSVQGSFHSVNSTTLANQNFEVTGLLQQGNNVGGSQANVSGTLTFTGYSCFDLDPQTNTAIVNVNGQISGNSVILQVFPSNGLNVGQIGAPEGFAHPSPVKFESSAAGGWVLHGVDGYGFSTKSCPGGNVPGDGGNLCIALGNPTACKQPINLSPGLTVFPQQTLGTTPTSQTITLTNIDPSGADPNEMTLEFKPQAGLPSPFGLSDFNGLPNYTEEDDCADPPGSTFTLDPGKSCTINVTFAPQQSCAWLPIPALGGVPPASCPATTLPFVPGDKIKNVANPLLASVIVHSSRSADGNNDFAVPIKGFGMSLVQPSVPELDFGSVPPGQTSLPQGLKFTNQGQQSVQILPALSTPCGDPLQRIVLPRPLAPGVVSGVQVVTTVDPDAPTIDYFCDSDLTTKLPNFQLTGDNCSGVTLAPGDSCAVEVTFVPQPATAFIPPLDYFLELNTLQCTDTVTTNCEIDAGRFPVELKANPPSPLRMDPGAVLNFGNWPQGLRTTDPIYLKIYNDPDDPNAQTINFTGNLLKGDYIETDDCGASLAPGARCTFTVYFKPKVLGYDPGSITITYQPGQTQTVYLRGYGTPQ